MAQPQLISFPTRSIVCVSEWVAPTPPSSEYSIWIQFSPDLRAIDEVQANPRGFGKASDGGDVAEAPRPMYQTLSCADFIEMADWLYRVYFAWYLFLFWHRSNQKHNAQHTFCH